jgi:hypothetical protein
MGRRRGYAARLKIGRMGMGMGRRRKGREKGKRRD